ncbi:MAG: DUF5320 domain-containing protein [bacterium]
MPRGDGTGPMGMGPMTGRAAGYCAGYQMPGYANSIPGWGFGMGFGRGRGFSMGRGRGFRHWYYATGLPGWARFGYPQPAYPYPPSVGYPYGPELTPDQERRMLHDEANALKQSLQDVESRISALEKATKKAEK